MSRARPPDYGNVPKQKAPKGLKIPLPKRDEIIGPFRKIAKLAAVDASLAGSA